MTDLSSSEPDPDETAAFAKRVRRMMLISGLTTAIAIGAVFIAIGYRLFRGEASRNLGEMTATLPKGARIVSTAVADDRLIVTVDAGGRIEIHTFDVRTLKPAGRLRFAQEP